MVTTSQRCLYGLSLLLHRVSLLLNKFKMFRIEFLIFPFQTYSSHRIHISIVLFLFPMFRAKALGHNLFLSSSQTPHSIGSTFQTQTESNHFSLHSPQPCSKNHNLCLDYSDSFLIDLLFYPCPLIVYSQHSS